MKKYVWPRVLTALLCTLSFLTSFSQGRKITGTVTDDKGAPVADATVSIKNTTANAVTNTAGSLTINVPANGKTLVVSYVGMQPREAAIGAGDNFNFSLVRASNTLSDVVVVGYGTAKRACRKRSVCTRGWQHAY